MATTLKGHLAKTFAKGLEYYAQNLAALSHAQLDASPGGAARAGYDFTYEVVVVHRRIAARISGRDPGPSPFGESWMLAPPEFRNPETAMAELRDSGKEVLAAFENVPEEGLEVEIPVPSGTTSPLAMMELACAHITYHDAQLNYIQALHGDEKMHWEN